MIDGTGPGLFAVRRAVDPRLLSAWPREDQSPEAGRIEGVADSGGLRDATHALPLVGAPG